MRGRPLHLLRNVLIVPDTGTCSIVAGAGDSWPFPKKMSEILKGKYLTCLYNYSRALEMLIERRLLNIYLLLSLYHVFVVSQGPIRPVSYHVTSFSRLLKQQIAVFVPYNFLSKLSTDIVTFSNIPAANIWYFLSPSPLPTPPDPNPPSTTR